MPQHASSSHWYLVYCKPRQEQLAQQNLERQHYRTYLPRTRVIRRRASQRKEYIEPLFPRYLFIRLDTALDDWRPIRSTLGVISLVSFGQSPARVPDGLIQALQSKQDMDGLLPLPKPALHAGDKVTLMEGPMAGYQALFVAPSGKQRVNVLLQIMGKQVRLNLPLHTLDTSS